MAQFGFPGVAVLGMAWWIWHQNGVILQLQKNVQDVHELRVKDAQHYAESERVHSATLREVFDKFQGHLECERNARLEDAKAAGVKAIELHAEVHRTVDKVTDLVEVLHRPRSGSYPQLQQP